MAEPNTRSSAQVMDEAMTLAQSLHQMARECDIDLMVFIAALHIADKLAVFYWMESEPLTPADVERVERDAQRVREIVQSMKLGLLSKRASAPGSPGVINSITMLDRLPTEKPKPGESN